MTRAQELHSEMIALFKWHTERISEIDEKLKAQGKYRMGLDTNQKYYSDVNNEYNRHFKEIIERYKDLPPDTKSFE